MINTDLLILISLLCYLIFFLATRAAWKKGSEKIIIHKSGVPDSSIVCSLQLAGILFLGLFTGIIRMPEQMDFLSFPQLTDHYLVPEMALLIITVFIISWFAAEQKIKRPGSFSIRLYNSPRNTAGYLSLRILFLMSYEFFFRGVLLFDVAALSGITISIIVNIVLYVIIHLFDDRQTIISAVPFGIVLCWLSLETRSIWPAVILHMVLSLTYEIRMLTHSFHSTQKSII